MALTEIYHERDQLGRIGSVQLASVSFDVSQDPSAKMDQSLSLVVSLRALGVDIRHVTVSPFKDGPIVLPLLDNLGGPIKGRIDDFGFLDEKHAQVDQKKDTTYATATYACFLVTGDANATITLSAIPVGGLLAKLVAGAIAKLGGKLTINIGHRHIVAPLFHNKAAT